jgi:hypothetical protein
MASITSDDAPILPRCTNQMPDGIFGKDTYNLTRVLNIMGIQPLMAAIRTA